MKSTVINYKSQFLFLKYVYPSCFPSRGTIATSAPSPAFLLGAALALGVSSFPMAAPETAWLHACPRKGMWKTNKEIAWFGKHDDYSGVNMLLYIYSDWGPFAECYVLRRLYIIYVYTLLTWFKYHSLKESAAITRTILGMLLRIQSG